MNVADLEKRLLSVARRDKPSDKVPYAFEKRIMALLSPLPTPDCWGLWAGALWRATVPCLVLMVILAGWSLRPNAPASSSENLSQEMDNTVLAAIDQTAEQSE